MDSSENSVRRLAESIYHYMCRGCSIECKMDPKEDEASHIESLLSEAMEQNLEEEIKERLGLLEAVKMKEARSAAYRDAAEIAEAIAHDDGLAFIGSNHEPFKLSADTATWIADKLRRKSEGM